MEGDIRGRRPGYISGRLGRERRPVSAGGFYTGPPAGSGSCRIRPDVRRDLRRDQPPGRSVRVYGPRCRRAFSGRPCRPRENRGDRMARGLLPCDRHCARMDGGERNCRGRRKRADPRRCSGDWLRPGSATGAFPGTGGLPRRAAEPEAGGCCRGHRRRPGRHGRGALRAVKPGEPQPRAPGALAGAGTRT